MQSRVAYSAPSRGISIISEIQICINLAIKNKNNNKKDKNKPRKPWITKGIINSFKTKENLYKIWKRNPNNEVLKKDFKNYERILNRVIKDAKIRYEQKKIESYKQNTKHLWNFINEKLARKVKKVNNIDYIIHDKGKKNN